ncbi:LytTR family transcriptional regulator [Lactobacillus sp. CC-MHH1034]|uniref:LytTR family DNA-binding domain-containing protein n=1 Tax=Agrilactobacillus fermenti TaxID=2586909 RepID=UPI001E43A94E|nr:LytTR family DNA-binding domain-containing protein [Agrilactobacillus fermenti]MCD2256710.1 LytTR family transcriptional regulator [Agrilactobacillus fermenti]
MQIQLELDPDLNDTEIQIIIKAKIYSKTIDELIQYLTAFQRPAEVIAVPGDDQISMIKVKNVIAIEIFKNELDIHTVNGTLKTQERLYRFLAKLPQQNFVQISKSSAINVTHLIRLEAGFSGNMTAILDQEYRQNVSRKYLHDLKQKLGV